MFGCLVWFFVCVWLVGSGGVPAVTAEGCPVLGGVLLLVFTRQGFLGAGVLLGLVCSLVEPEKQKKDGVA